MKNNFKWISLALILCMAVAIFAGCDQSTPETPGRPVAPNNNTNSTTAESTTEEKTTEEPAITEYNNFSTISSVLTLEQLFEQAVAESNQSYNTGSDYPETSLTNIFTITDYIANYEQYVKEYELEEALDEIYAETGFTLDMGFAAQMMKHYIDGEGVTYDFTSAIPELLTSNKIKGAQTITINAAMAAAENLVKNGESGVTINQTKALQFSSLKPADGSAYYALGNFNAVADLTNVQRDGDNLSATVTFRIVDFYNWSQDDTTPLFADVLKDLKDSYRNMVGEIVDLETMESFCQKDLAQLHRAGWAKNYLASGSITYTVTWTAGQTFDQATVVPAQ